MHNHYLKYLIGILGMPIILYLSWNLYLSQENIKLLNKSVTAMLMQNYHIEGMKLDDTCTIQKMKQDGEEIFNRIHSLIKNGKHKKALQLCEENIVPLLLSRETNEDITEFLLFLGNECWKGFDNEEEAFNKIGHIFDLNVAYTEFYKQPKFIQEREEFGTQHNVDDVTIHPVYIKYKQKVNGYQVYVTWFMEEFGEIYPSFAILKFVDSVSIFTVSSEAFYIDNMDKIVSDSLDTFFNKYHYYPKEYRFIHNFDYHTNPNPKDSLDYDAPFFFSDVDFDGEQELVITSYKSGQRFADGYKIYKSNEYSRNPYAEVKEIPYTHFDSFTRFDYKNKKVILESHCGASDYHKTIYKYCDSCYNLPLIFEKGVVLK